MNNKYFLGIDLGTTNTVAAVGKKDSNTNKIKSDTLLIKQKNNLGEPTLDKILPSLLYVGDDSLEIGKFAKAMKEQNSKNVIDNIKLLMGTHEVREINKKEFRPYEVSAEYLKACRESASDEYFYPFDDVVITVPSSCDPEMRRDTKRAAILAGFKEDKIHIIEEPTAALIDYVYSKSTIDFTNKKRILVYDIGGGTSDISVIDVQIVNNEINLEEKAKNRYDNLGGVTFDEQCAERLLEEIIKEHNIDEQQLSQNKKEKMIFKLRIFAELVKERFSTKIDEGKTTEIEAEKRTIPQLYNSNDIEVTITCDEYIEYISSLLYASKEKAKTIDDIEKCKNIETPILDTLKEYNIELDSIDYVYLTGGMSKFPLIKERLKSILQTKNEIIMAENPFESVANGAAIYNYYKDKIHEVKLDDLNSQVNNTFNDMVIYSNIQEKINGNSDNIGEIKIKKILPSAVIVNTLNGLPKVIIKKNEPYPSEGKRILENVLKTTSTRGIRLEIYSGMDEYDTGMTIQSIYVKEFDRPTPIGTKIDIEYFLDENAILEMNLIVKDEKEYQIYPLNSVDVVTTKIKNNYKKISNLTKRNIFYEINIPKNYIESLETVYKDYYNDNSKIFELYSNLQNICNDMLNNRINPIESLLYTSKICNDMIESEYNQESGFSNFIATIINDIVKNNEESSKKVIEHILKNWTWRPQLQIIYNCCASIENEELKEELLKKCYLSYEKNCSSPIKKGLVSYSGKVLDKSILKYVILKSMILSGFPSLLSNIHKIITDLSKNEEVDRQIYNYFTTEIFNHFEEEGLKTLYDLFNIKYHLPDYSYELVKDFNKKYEKNKNKEISKYNEYNQIISDLDSPNLKIRRQAYTKAYIIDTKGIVETLYKKLENGKENDGQNIGYALIAIGRALNKRDYLSGKEEKVKEIFNRYENKNNKGYLLSCYASQIISGLYEEEIKTYYEKISYEIINSNEYNNKNYIKFVVKNIKNYEVNKINLRFTNYLIEYIKNAIDKTDDCEQLKIIIDNYLSLIVNECITNELEKDILSIRKRKKLNGNTDELYLKILEFINKCSSNNEISHTVLFDFCNNSIYSKEVKVQATKYLNQDEIKEGVSCG